MASSELQAVTDRTGKPRSLIRSLLQSEAAGGLVLMGAAAAALVIANGPLAEVYFRTLNSYVGPLSILHWINDLLMAGFFLLVGLEIKREFLDGQLASRRRRILPCIAAAGGMVVPAGIYLLVNVQSGTLRGWAIPSATDIAFALGVLALLGRRVPVSLRIFLAALAIIDDLLAVAIIAIFYTGQLAPLWLGLAVIATGVLMVLNRMGVRRLSIFVIGGGALWLFTYLSGVHGTIAGVALAATIPIRCSPACPDDAESPLHIMEHAIQPWVAFAVIPLFGFANAGVSLAGVGLDRLLAPVTLGIGAGLFLGKQAGVFLSAWTAVRLGYADTPEGATMAQVYGVAVLCGIGFTMSLFIGLLAYPGETLQAQVKLGVLVGSCLSAAFGALILTFARSETAPSASARW